MADPAGWLARFAVPGERLAEGVVLLAPGPDGGPPRRVVDPVPAGGSRVLGRWRLVSADLAARTADYAPDLG